MAKNNNKNEISQESSGSNNDIFSGFTKHTKFDVYVKDFPNTNDSAPAFIYYRPDIELAKDDPLRDKLSKTHSGHFHVYHNYSWDIGRCVSDKRGNLYAKHFEVAKLDRKLRIHPIFANEPHIKHVGDKFQCAELDDHPYHDFGKALICIPGYEGRSLRISKVNPIFYQISDWTFIIETYDFSVYRPDLPEKCDLSIKRHLQEEYVELASTNGLTREIRIIHPQRFGDADAHLVHGFMNYPIDADFKMMLRTTSYDRYIGSSPEVSISMFES